MAVVLGDAQLQGSVVNISPPEGAFGGIEAVRLSNYTGAALILTDIDAEQPGQQYLMPFQQMVYKIQNFRQPPKITALFLGSDFDTETLLVEWSTSALADFPGVYPCTLTQADISAPDAPDIARVTLRHLNGVDTEIVTANARRHSVTVVNAGTTGILWNSKDDFTDQPTIAPGSGRTMEYKGALYFMSDAPGGLLEVFQD